MYPPADYIDGPILTFSRAAHSFSFYWKKGVASSERLRDDIHIGRSTIRSYFMASFTTVGCIYLRITAEDFPVISHGLIQCLTPFAEKDPSSMTQMQPLGRGMVKAPLQKP